MIEDVFEAFLSEYEIQKCLGFCEEEIDGYSGFIFSTSVYTVYSASAVNNAISRIIKAYNKREKIEAKEEKREAVLLPSFSAHNLRHTFCTRFCENETNLKVIQVISMDLEKFFDTVSHSNLIEVLSQTIKDGRVISLIHKYPNAGVSSKGFFEKSGVSI